MVRELRSTGPLMMRRPIYRRGNIHADVSVHCHTARLHCSTKTPLATLVTRTPWQSSTEGMADGDFVHTAMGKREAGGWSFSAVCQRSKL